MSKKNKIVNDNIERRKKRNRYRIKLSRKDKIKLKKKRIKDLVKKIYKKFKVKDSHLRYLQKQKEHLTKNNKNIILFSLISIFFIITIQNTIDKED